MQLPQVRAIKIVQDVHTFDRAQILVLSALVIAGSLIYWNDFSVLQLIAISTGILFLSRIICGIKLAILINQTYTERTFPERWQQFSNEKKYAMFWAERLANAATVKIIDVRQVVNASESIVGYVDSSPIHEWIELKAFDSVTGNVEIVKFDYIGAETENLGVGEICINGMKYKMAELCI